MAALACVTWIPALIHVTPEAQTPATPSAAAELPRVEIIDGSRSAQEVSRLPNAPLKPQKSSAEPSLIPVVSETPADPAPADKPPVEGTATLTVSGLLPEPTFIYLDGGSVLGEGAVREKQIPAGRHRLLYWSPNLGKRAVQSFEAAPGAQITLNAPVIGSTSASEDHPGQEG
jgi:hypothetical protein